MASERAYLHAVKDEKLKIHGTFGDVLKVAMRPKKKATAKPAKKAAKRAKPKRK